MKKKSSRIDPQKRNLRGNPINWNQVFYFSEIASRGSIKEAASYLNLSPSTLSEHVAQLEKDLDLQLFIRSHRKLTLTPEGARLFQYAKQMFETGQRLIDVVSPIPLGSYPVSVGLVPGFSLPLAYRFIGDYLASHDLTSFKFHHSRHEDLEKGLAEARLDFGFSDRLPERKDITARLISSSSLQFVVTAPLASRSLSDLLQELPLLVCNSEVRTRSAVEMSLEEPEIAPKAVVTSDYPSLLWELCKEGKGIGVFSEEAIEQIESAKLKPLKTPKGTPKLRADLYALWSTGAENSAAIQILKDLLPEAHG